MSNISELQKHIEFKKTSVKSKGKLQDIERYLKLFMSSTNEPLSKLDENDLAKFFNSLDYSIGTINGIKSYVKVFIKWYYPDWSSRFRNLDKLCKLQKTQRAYEPEQMLSLKEVEKLIKEEKDLMFKVYWLVFFYGGFRPSEACNLKWEDVYFEPKGLIIKLHTSKTGKDFYKALPKNAEQYLKQWKKSKTSEWVFPSSSALSHGETIGARSVCARLKRHSKKVLGKEVVPYQLRHSIATILYGDDQKKDDVVAEQLGHNKSMRSVYMNLDTDKIKERARRLWIKPEKLSPEKKHELEERIKNMEEQEIKTRKMVIELLNKFQKDKNKSYVMFEDLKKN